MSAGQLVRWHLVVIEGVEPGATWDLYQDEGNLSGYTDEKWSVDIDLRPHFRPDLKYLLSPQYARITVEGDQLYIMDLGSEHGTSINKEDRLQPDVPRHLYLNDTVRIGGEGGVKLRVRAGPGNLY